MKLSKLKIGATTLVVADDRFANIPLYISAASGYRDSFEMTMTVPVDAKTLKEKGGMDGLVMDVNAYVSKLTGSVFTHPTISKSTKAVTFTWEVDDPYDAYAYGLDMTAFRGSAKVDMSKYKARLAFAEKAMKELAKFKDDARKAMQSLPEAEKDAKWKSDYMPAYKKLADDYEKHGISYTQMRRK